MNITVIKSIIEDLFEALAEMNKADSQPQAPRQRQNYVRRRGLTARQLEFCELIAGGAAKAAAYSQVYTTSGHLRSSADSAARMLLRQGKIRDQIIAYRKNPETPLVPFAHDLFDQLRSEGAHGGWCFQLTQNQEAFCRAVAEGAEPSDAHRVSGYAKPYTLKATQAAADRMMEMPKIKQRIAALKGGYAPDIKTIRVGRRQGVTLDPDTGKEVVETETEAEAEAEVEVEVLEVEVEVEVEAEVEGEVAVLALAGLEGGSPPRRILEALARYAELHIQPGSFLTAVLENNLAEALLTADVDSLAALPEINRLIARHLPTPCYGSREKVAAWLGSERDELLRRANANTLRAYLDAEHDVGEAIGEARAGGTD
jgi:hypothetical protein